MNLPYPQNTVWYVEASSADGQGRASGSGVAVWLQRVGQPKTRRKYLLTCSHVVRGPVPGSPARDGEAGYGPVLPVLSVWGPDTGYPGARFQATLAHSVKPVDIDALREGQRSNTADDWVVLQLEDAQASQAMDSVREWAAAEPGDLQVIGYPGGERSFERSKVIPTTGDDLAFRDLFHGVLRLIGMETRAGMSGGGVFDEQHRLVGIHRSRQDAVLQCHSVSVTTILDELHASGYEVVPAPKPMLSRLPAFIKRPIVWLMGCAMTLILAFLAIPPRPGPVPPPSHVTCRIVDASTDDWIDRPFTITNKRGTSPECRGLDCRVGAEYIEPPCSVRVSGKGYNEGHAGYKVNRDEKSPDGNVYVFRVDRNSYYKESIGAPGADAWPSDAEVRRIEEENRSPIKGVIPELRFRNDTTSLPDLLLYPLRPKQSPTLESPPVRKPLIVPGEKFKDNREGYVKHLALTEEDMQKLGFDVYVSFHGRPAQRVGTGPLTLNAKFPIVHIESMEPSFGSFSPSNNDPLAQP